MLGVFGSNYLIIDELAVEWLPSATKMLVDEDAPKAVYPVWLMDALGIRAAMFVRCPTCQQPLGISPGDAKEQTEWNKKEPKVSSIMGCGKCANLWMITNDRAYHLMVMPPQQSTIPRILRVPAK